MTTDGVLRRRVWAFVFALVLATGCTSAVGVRGGLPQSRVEAFGADVGASYRLFSARCSRCHTLDRPLSADVRSLDHWKAYVSRMRRNPGSGISPRDGEQILVFLAYWMDESKRAEAADE